MTLLLFTEEVVRRCFYKEGVLRNFTKFTGLRPATLLKKETLAQVFSCGFCEISKNTFLHRTPLVAASVFMNDLIKDLHSKVAMDKIKKAAKHVAATLLLFCFY